VNITHFLPLIISTLGLKAPKPPKDAPIHIRTAFVDFIAAQVKVLA